MDQNQRRVKEFSLKWKHFPWDFFTPSAKVDVSLLFLGLKKAARIKLNRPGAGADVIKMSSLFCAGEMPHSLGAPSQQLSLYGLHADSYIYLSSHDNCFKLKEYDLRSIPHTLELGDLLGYPPCCVRKIAEVGEENIDHFDLRHNNHPLTHPLLKTISYLQGYACISHVPCCFNCQESLLIAKNFLSFLRKVKGSNLGCAPLNRWSYHLFNTIGVV